MNDNGERYIYWMIGIAVAVFVLALVAATVLA